MGSQGALSLLSPRRVPQMNRQTLVHRGVRTQTDVSEDRQPHRTEPMIHGTFHQQVKTK